ncbi:aspartic peptidase domain-containing protein [Mycena floridula]|nr:aspartic peptidase domain-containing protein [Mycena floridula]
MNEPMDIDPIDSDLGELEDYSEDHIVELVLTPPIHYNDVHFMLQADCVRLQTRLPSRLEDQLPGYYYKGPGELFVVSSHSASRSPESESASISASAVETSISDKLVRRRSPPKNRTKPYPPAKPAARDISVNSYPVFGDITNLNATPQVNYAQQTPFPRGFINDVRQMIRTLPPTPVLQPPFVDPRDEFLLQQGIKKYGYPNEAMLHQHIPIVVDYAGDYAGMQPNEKGFVPPTAKANDESLGFDDCITEIITSVSTLQNPAINPHQALYTTEMSWGTSSVHDIDATPCIIAMETGSSLSWVLKRGFQRLPDIVRQETSEPSFVPLLPWPRDNDNIKLLMARYGRSVCFENESATAYLESKRYPTDKCITYSDETTVATIHFKDIVTFEARVGPHGPLTIEDFPFRAAIATNTRLFRRNGYDGVLGLGPELSLKERHIAGDEDPHASETLMQALFNRGIILKPVFYLTFETNQGILSLGGLRKCVQDKVERMSGKMTVIQPTERPDLDFKEHQQWTLHLSGISVDVNNDARGKNGVPLFNPSGAEKTLPLPENSKNPVPAWPRLISFDSGCRYSHFNVDIIKFFQDLGLLGLQIPSARNYTCNKAMAQLVSITFHFKGSTTATRPFQHTISGTDLLLSTPRPTDAAQFLPSAIASSGDSEFNVWGNKHMLGMAIGYQADSIAGIRLGILKKPKQRAN